MTARRGFSLIEVVIAIGVLAVGLTAVLGLMAGAAKMIAIANDRRDAERALADGIAELERLGFAAAAAKVTAERATSAEDARFYLSRDGTKTGWGSALAAQDRHYVVTVFRVENLSPPSADATGAGLAVQVRVEWPANVDAEHSMLQLSHVLLR
ncbi:MAG: prepilin-type N-terminal cleavage/methylation domain-containing protein [Opitutae bacterium]|nr:prepilin-type N-terminal cleavage/methylation domain-containing protein [Opitutae bacterium]